ncbi:MAG: DUF1294 domain-containing protein [Bacteroidales bacterium]|nr:DUF1294 domain-containing protein [Candidatus Physcocola equi]
MNNIAIYALIGINIVAFAMYGIDKWKAKKSKWRIPEANLLAVAAFGGALGAWLGMKTFRHKTQHKKFIIFVPLFLIAWIIFLCWHSFK